MNASAEFHLESRRPRGRLPGISDIYNRETPVSPLALKGSILGLAEANSVLDLVVGRRPTRVVSKDGHPLLLRLPSIRPPPSAHPLDVRFPFSILRFQTFLKYTRRSNRPQSVLISCTSFDVRFTESLRPPRARMARSLARRVFPQLAILIKLPRLVMCDYSLATCLRTHTRARNRMQFNKLITYRLARLYLRSSFLHRESFFSAGQRRKPHNSLIRNKSMLRFRVTR